MFKKKCIDVSPLHLERSEYNRDINCYNIRDRTIVMQSARGKQVKEKRNPLLDQVKHTGLTHFKPSSTIITNRHEGKTSTAGDHCDGNDDDDVDENIPTISGRLKAISDKYLKSSTHRFLAKFYKNPSTKSNEKSAEIEEPNSNEHANKINKVSNKCTYIVKF